MDAPTDLLDGRIVEVVHRLLAIAEDLLDCALSGQEDLKGFVRDFVRTRNGNAVLRVPVGELVDALRKPHVASRQPVPVTRKQAVELLLRLVEDCRGSQGDDLPIAPNPQFLEEVKGLLSRLPADLFDEDRD